LHWEDHVVVDEKFLRPAEVDVLVGDATKAHTTLDWKPEIGFPDLIEMMVDADLATLRR
jgi:GDPmannose 4,6-dehydratase